ncbi:MAG: MotA/TolQ/ExbB proton channel family protein [Phycisphaeraceae bacterium]|nr:MotA/TolQ/ExbB proton channel family protein [Phycisphaeraceae bacterium]
MKVAGPRVVALSLSAEVLPQRRRNGSGKLEAMSGMIESWRLLMERGGPVMWPLLALSVLSVGLCFERMVFFWRTNRPGRLAIVARMSKLLRAGQRDAARQLAATDPTVHGEVVMRLLEEPADQPVSEAAMVEAVESQRRRLDRYLPTLSTIITAAPMLGILGTVLGIITSFEALSSEATTADPRLVGEGIAQALLTTAAGLVVALITLFPYNLLRAQSHRTLSRLEILAAAAGAPRGADGSALRIDRATQKTAGEPASAADLG